VLIVRSHADVGMTECFRDDSVGQADGEHDRRRGRTQVMEAKTSAALRAVSNPSKIAGCVGNFAGRCWRRLRVFPEGSRKPCRD
jgi:hypothetical protein